MERIINSIERLNESRNLEPAEVVMVFRTQKLLDLWINEMEGQISDGQWENSRGTEWIWRGRHIYQIGPETKVYTRRYYITGRKNFYMDKELCEIIGERAQIEAGFETIKEMRAAWTEIANAIRNAETMPEDMRHRYVDDIMEEARQQRVSWREKAIELLESQADELVQISNSYNIKFYALKFEDSSRYAPIHLYEERKIFDIEVSGREYKATLENFKEVARTIIEFETKLSHLK